jgi:ubiquinone/menaquinone biosynthesis C-methylase UbiE
MGFYAERILPRIVDASLGTDEASTYRKMATDGLAGTVVEIGFGSGLNVAHYPSAVTQVYAVEPSTRARELARPRISASPVPVEMVGLHGEDLPLDDAVADAVLSTWTMCTIPQLDRALAEMRRVLRPGGRLHFLEHGLHADAKVRRWQHRLDPLQQRLFGGCHLNRHISDLVTGAGFEIDEMANHQMRGPRPFGYLYQGRAISPA